MRRLNSRNTPDLQAKRKIVCSMMLTWVEKSKNCMDGPCGKRILEYGQLKLPFEERMPPYVATFSSLNRSGHPHYAGCWFLVASSSAVCK